MTTTQQQLFVLLQLALRPDDAVPAVLCREDVDWDALLREAKRQSLVGVAYAGVEQLMRLRPTLTPPPMLLAQWYGLTDLLRQRSAEVDQDAALVTEQFRAAGFDSCVLKGQGLALLYGDLVRAPGDIDIWVMPHGGRLLPLFERRRQVYRYCRSLVPHLHAVYHHVDLPIGRTDVEVHFTPSWMYSPLMNRRLQRFFATEWTRRQQANVNSLTSVQQFNRFLSPLGNDRQSRATVQQKVHTNLTSFCIPSTEMNLVYVLVHIYRHLFQEGIGLRQLLDYYFVLLHSTVSQRAAALVQLRRLGMARFASATMYVLREVFGMPAALMLCAPDEREGRFLLSEIMQAGNFGQHDSRRAAFAQRPHHTPFQTFLFNVRHTSRLLTHYPHETLCAPFWKIWHYYWRKANGYL